MADTGAPWNIPFVSPTDNPRVFPAADEAQALAIAAGLSAAGVFKQIVQTVVVDTFVSSSTTFVDVTGYTATITPEDDANLVLVRVVVNTGHSANNAISNYTVTDSSNNVLFSPTSPGNRVAAFQPAATSAGQQAPAVIEFIHAPGVASAFTYKVRGKANAGTWYVNRSTTDSDTAVFSRSISSITLIEIKP